MDSLLSIPGAARTCGGSNRAQETARAPKRAGAWTRLKHCFICGSNREGGFRRDSDLVGKTIDPAIAVKYRKNLDLTGTGEILGVRNINEKKYRVILNHSIAPLSLTAARRDTAIRTPGECVINALAAARATVADMQVLHAIENTLRATWLDGSLSRQGALNVLSLIRKDVADVPALLPQLDRIEASMERTLYITRRNDNLYGRLFETHLAEFIVKHPDESMIAVRDQLASFIISDFVAYTEDEAARVIEGIASMMRHDPAPWRSAIPEACDFMEGPSTHSFAKMLNYEGGKSVPLLLSLGVQYAIVAPGLEDLLNEASAFYSAVIVGQRTLVDGNRAKLRTDMHGLLLPYQRGAHPHAATAEGVGKRPIDKYVRPGSADGMTQHDWNAVKSERTIGIGMSGSSNILDYVFRRISKGNPEFPMNSAHLATAAWLSHSGGHSFNEAYSVFGFGQNKDFAPLSFNGLEMESDTASDAVAYAFNEVVLEAERLYRLEDAS